jgi:hypothetical protein
MTLFGTGHGHGNGEGEQKNSGRPGPRGEASSEQDPVTCRASEELMRPDGRDPDKIRSVTIEPDFTRYAEGSVLWRAGGTVVLCNASYDDRTAPFLRGPTVDRVAAPRRSNG